MKSPKQGKYKTYLIICSVQIDKTDWYISKRYVILYKIFENATLVVKQARKVMGLFERSPDRQMYTLHLDIFFIN